ncbi:MAG: amino acid ABC transporter substrate-binding protein, partial [Pelagibacteraceae bacterium]
MKNLIKIIGSLSVFAFILTACGDGGKKTTSTLDTTKKQGFVKCGVSQGLPGFSNADAGGKWTGIDVDVCRAVAAAVLGDASK